jgi:hypothetical protein
MPWTWLLNWRIWAVVGIAGLFMWGWVQTKRIASYKADLTTLQAEYDTFKARVAVEGKAAQERADKQSKEDKLRKEQSDAENKRIHAIDLQRINSLRHDADSSGRYLMPSTAANAGRAANAICFERTEFESANRAVLERLRAIADEGDAATLDLNTAKNWATKRSPQPD